MSGGEARQAGNAFLALVANNYGLFSPLISGEELADFLQAWARLVIEIIKQESEARSRESAKDNQNKIIKEKMEDDINIGLNFENIKLGLASAIAEAKPSI